MTISIPDELVTKGSTTITAGGVQGRAIRSGDGEEPSSVPSICTSGTRNQSVTPVPGVEGGCLWTVSHALHVDTQHTPAHKPKLIFKGLSGLKCLKIKKYGQI